MNKAVRFFAFSIILLLNLPHVSGQNNAAKDTLSLTLDQAEATFLSKNFQLLAAKYNISAADAALTQARLYNNPTLSIDQGAYNKDTKKWFDLSKTGETAASLEQLIFLAGKRNKLVNIQKANIQLTQFQFYDLIRTLRHELRTSFSDLYFLQQSMAVYDGEISSVKTLIAGYDIQYKNGNIAFRELARLQALQFGLENERFGLMQEAMERQKNISLLTGDTLGRPIKPILNIATANAIAVDNISYTQLIDSGMHNRYDLQMAGAQVNLNEANVAYQKALAVPDLTLGVNWDKAGSYVANYNSASVRIDLPLWNRNQGNIKIAEYQAQGAKQLLEQTQLIVKSDIGNALTQLLEADRLYKSAAAQFGPDYDKLLSGVLKGYQSRTISLLEFIDYYETYKDSRIEYNHLQNNRLDLLEDLNYATGKTLFNY
jgi:cobalt-zinc-cadmium efflux system outer membrane protein